MGKLGLGYGSEFHLLRFLGRHRNLLDKKILWSLGYLNGHVEWLDYKFAPKMEIPDKEYVGIDFLESHPNYLVIKESWKGYWPSTNRAQNWDAICKIKDEWILIEAKAHANEMISNSAASEKSKDFITTSFNKLKRDIRVSSKNDWNVKYYQKANRVLFLKFLLDNNIKARLLFIYFINGYSRDGIQYGVKSIKEWSSLINEQNEYLGIKNNMYLKDKIVDLVINVDK